jgi:hypothetical protein
MKKVYKDESLLGELLRPVSRWLESSSGILLLKVSVCRLIFLENKFLFRNALNQVSTSVDAFKRLFRLRFYSNSNLLETAISSKNFKTQR